MKNRFNHTYPVVLATLWPRFALALAFWLPSLVGGQVLAQTAQALPTLADTNKPAALHSLVVQRLKPNGSQVVHLLAPGRRVRYSTLQGSTPSQDAGTQPHYRAGRMHKSRFLGATATHAEFQGATVRLDSLTSLEFTTRKLRRTRSHVSIAGGATTLGAVLVMATMSSIYEPWDTWEMLEVGAIIALAGFATTLTGQSLPASHHSVNRGWRFAQAQATAKPTP